jgi:hypothetical protein
MAKKKDAEVKPASGTTLMMIPRAALIKAEWNYKDPGEHEDIEKLAASIKHDRSAGVLAVREMPESNPRVYEVIDGNHRLEALDLVGWEEIPCENFGLLPLHEAITVSTRRNHNWFKDDVVALANLFKNEVIPHIPIEDLIAFMPQTETDFNNMVKLSDFSWDNFNSTSDDKSSGLDIAPPIDPTYNESDYKDIYLKMPVELFERWETVKESIKSDKGLKSDVAVFEKLLDNFSIGDQSDQESV